MRCLFAAMPLCLCFSSGYYAHSLDTRTFPQGLKILASSRPLVIGHRGYVQLAPENTLASFQIAIATGVDLVELDYYHSRDGIPVVIHDRTLDRTTDAEQKWGLKDLTPGSKNADELQTLDAGAWFNPRYAGERIPLLTEALQLIQQANITLIEQKQGDAATCVKLLRERDLINRVVVQSFDWSYLRDFHALAAEQILGALGPPSRWNGRELAEQEKALNTGWLEEIARTGARIVVWNRQVTRSSVAEAHKRGHRVWVYTINDAELANSLLDAGIDGLITDNPAIIWKTLALRNVGRQQ